MIYIWQQPNESRENTRMNGKTKTHFILGLLILILFVVYTLSLTFIDVQPIGPQGSYVGWAGINKAIHELFGVNMTIYNITDWAGLIAVFIAFCFAARGLVQWITRKSIMKVDSSLLVLGVFYIIVFGTYLFFEFHVINRRPVMINGILESSYPSSTTMLAMCVFPTAMMQFKCLIKNTKVRNAVNFLCVMFTVFMVSGRLICGVHWFTDILGGLIFSAAMILLYSSLINLVSEKQKTKIEHLSYEKSA